jgi:hypothetical protein
MRRAGLAALALFLAVGHARADMADFYGNWENNGRDRSGITHVVISPAGGNQVSVRFYGDCHPIECNWGQVDARSYSADPRSDNVETIVATIDAGFARREIVFHKARDGVLPFEVMMDFVDGTGLHNFAVSGTLRHTAWAGPVSQNWEKPAAQETGWGGGARGGVSRQPVETCTAFDPGAMKAAPVGGTWVLSAGGKVLADAGNDRPAAMRALDTICHYRFDRKCHTGAPEFAYWRRSDGFPSRRIGGADCIAFNTATAHVARIGRSWKVVDGVQWLAEFNDNAKSEAVLSLIRAYHLDAECFVRRSDPVMIYWLAE